MGFWISLTAGVLSLAVLIVRGVPAPALAVWVAGCIFAVAYAVGFIILIMRCLQIGPSGPTVAINNSAMVFGVLYGVLWLDPHTPNTWILAGAIGVFAALAMIGLGGRPNPSDAHPVGRAWLPLVLLGGAFSGVSFMVQTHVGLRHPGLEDGLWLVSLGFGQSAVILLLSAVRDPRILWRRRRERFGGMALGVSNAVGLPLTLLAFRHLGSEIVLPVSVTTPMVLVMVLGSVLYRERLTRLTWAGCLLAAFSVGLIGYGSARNERPAHGPRLSPAAWTAGKLLDHFGAGRIIPESHSILGWKEEGHVGTHAVDNVVGEPCRSPCRTSTRVGRESLSCSWRGL
jgi:drug/metabolite transporter (DMT)-like permease